MMTLKKGIKLCHPNSRSSKPLKGSSKLEGIHNELTTSYNLLKEEYTNLKINHDNLVVSHELLSHEPHYATNHVVKIDIATSCDDLIVESIEKVLVAKARKWLSQTTMMIMQAQE